MAELDIPKETIAKVLGHADNDVTSIYIKFDNRKIDDAMRKVIDYVNTAPEEVTAAEGAKTEK